LVVGKGEALGVVKGYVSLRPTFVPSAPMRNSHSLFTNVLNVRSPTAWPSVLESDKHGALILLNAGNRVIENHFTSPLDLPTKQLRQVAAR
jgi:hypothetical protein